MARVSNENLYNTSGGTGDLQKDAVNCFHLLEVYLDTPVNLTDRFHETTITTPTKGTSTVYEAVGGLLSFSSVVETTQIKVNTISISLNAGNNTSSGLIAKVMSEDLVNKRVAIYRSFDTDISIGDMNQTFLIFDGNIRSFNVSEGSTGSSVSIKVATHWANFEAKAGRITNTTTQSNTTRYASTQQFTSDKGFEYSSAMIADIQWGPSN